MLIMIATDGSAASIDAVRRVHPLLTADATLTLVTVIPPRINPNDDATGFAGSAVTPQEAEQIHTAERVAADAVLATAAAALGPVPVRQEVLVGEPGQAICEAATNDGASLVVVGTHNKGFLAKSFLGSVSTHVVRHAPCPVLVVPPARPDSD